MSKNTDFIDRFKQNLADLKTKQKPQQDDDGDEGGGGAGKRHRGSYGQEKLIKLIDKGTLKAKHFHTFLNKDRIDQHTLKETELSKEVAEHEAKSSAETPEKESEKRVKDYLEHETVSDLEKQWGETPAADWSEKSSADAANPLSQAAAEVYANGVMGASIQGAHGTGNPTGYIVQSWIGNFGQKTAETNRQALQKNRVRNSHAVATQNQLAFARQQVIAGDTNRLLNKNAIAAKNANAAKGKQTVALAADVAQDAPKPRSR